MLQPSQATNSNFREHLWKLRTFPKIQETEGVGTPKKHTTSMFQESKYKSGEHSQNSQWQSTEMGTDLPQNANNTFRKCEF